MCLVFFFLGLVQIVIIILSRHTIKMAIIIQICWVIQSACVFYDKRRAYLWSLWDWVGKLIELFCFLLNLVLCPLGIYLYLFVIKEATILFLREHNLHVTRIFPKELSPKFALKIIDCISRHPGLLVSNLLKKKLVLLLLDHSLCQIGTLVDLTNTSAKLLIHSLQGLDLRKVQGFRMELSTYTSGILINLRYSVNNLDGFLWFLCTTLIVRAWRIRSEYHVLGKLGG